MLSVFYKNTCHHNQVTHSILHIPINTLTTDPDTEVIVQTIIAMANHLDLNIIAEGVETEQQKQWLHNNGCFLNQGFLFSNPVSAEQFLIFLTQNHSPESM